MKKCPYCSEEIQDDAIKCRHCKEWLNKEDVSRSKTTETKQIPIQQDAKKGEEKLIKKENKILDLEPFVINAVSSILFLNGIGVLVFYLWSLSMNLVGQEGNRDVIYAFFDFFFAYNLYQRKPWARTWINIRSVIGCIIWVAVSIYQKNIFGAITQIVFFGSIIILLSGKIKQNKAKILSFVTLGILVYLISQNVIAIFCQERINKQISNVGQASYTSREYNYSIEAPGNWKIIKKKDFNKIEKTFVGTEAEIALVNSNGTGYCLVIPEKLEGYGIDYNLEALKNVALSGLEQEKVDNLECNLTSNYGDGGFEITWSAWDGGFHYKYMMFYIVYEGMGIKLLAWTFESGARDVFRDVVNIAANIKTFDK